MTGPHDRRRAGFKERTRVAEARATLREAVTTHGRTETIPVARAAGRTLAAPTRAGRAVPGYERAAMDGYAVRAADTFGASERDPAVLRAADSMGSNAAVRVHTGSELPEGADAVVMIEAVEEYGDDVEVLDGVAVGENVGAADEDVAADQRLHDAGHRLRPSDLGLLKASDVREVEVYDPPEVAVIPTGEELVQADPEPGEMIETNGLTVSRLAESWGATARYRDVVTDDADALREAVAGDCDADVVVTTGGSSVGERDLTPDVVADLGRLVFHGVALKPGHPVAAGVVDDTPVLCLPGYPVACIVNAVQFLRPVLKDAGGMPVPAFPSVEAELSGKLRSEPGVRTYARVTLDREGGEGEGDANGDGGETRARAEPVHTSGSGVLSTVALADGWVVIPESVEGYAAGETVTVEQWEVAP
ncbi:molybdopterin molybdotransferase [Halarchaeum rubridurum]|uniref:Molybdopterin molybdenumtransferase MoeA n=1 Tax=Halarchaeum rubridurum TaxID=489911 RepID=A0A830FSP7_9EURY|nr:molybdopterin molybdotransferase MoeA [Halarchaeum rubridurum]MBP1953865.1 molybdopterin molybdotransferase [Halarchaeum rubridurum]GGM55441.1 molybdopterin molybdenumtransferase MoeA [Halarchaeum rubridurum]